MDLKFGNKKVAPVVEEEIFVSGQVIGEMQTGGGGALYMAKLLVPGASATDTLYGHGDTKEQAVLDAIQTGKKKTARVLDRIAVLEKALDLIR